MSSTKTVLRFCGNSNIPKPLKMLYNDGTKRRRKRGAAVTPAEQYAMLNAANKEKVIRLIEKLIADESKNLPPLCEKK